MDMDFEIDPYSDEQIERRKGEVQIANPTRHSGRRIILYARFIAMDQLILVKPILDIHSIAKFPQDHGAQKQKPRTNKISGVHQFLALFEDASIDIGLDKVASTKKIAV
jgi:hypothetical protein